MRSLYSAVSGLKTHQTRMDVIGNNIANVNTEAFKASSVRFSEIMYQTTSGASAGNGAAGTGGKNAKQIGLGVKSGATAVNITGAGSAETTGNPFDLRLNDKNATNFFVVSDGTNRLFTRAGDFYVDGNGYLCMSSTGYTLQGWQVDAKGNVIKDTVSSLQVMSSATNTSAPEATTKAYVSGVLDKNDAQAADTGRIITIRGEVQQIDKITVFQNVFDLRRGKQVFGVLGRPGGDTAPFSEPFPNLGAVCRGLFLLQQKVELVHKIPGGASNGPVDGDGVPYRVLDNEHPRLFQVLAQALDVKADKAVGDVHGGTVIEEIQRTVHIEIQCLGRPVSLRDVLGQQGVQQIAQHGHILRPRVREVRLIDHLHRPVDNRFLNGLQARLAAHDELAEGQHEVGFQRQRVFFLRVVEVDVQGVHIVGAGRGQPDHLAAQPLHQGRILVLRVADDDIVLGHQHDKGDLPLAAHGFTAAGRAEHKAVGTAGLLAVQQDHVVGEGVEPVVHGVAAHEHLLGNEGDEHRQGRCGQAPFDLDTVEAQGQRGHQPVLLLEVQSGQKAVVGLGDAGRLGHGDLQLLPGLRCVQYQKGHVEHSLVAGLQVGEQVLRRTAISRQVAGEYVHIIAAAYRPLLLLYLHGVQVGDLPLDHFDGLVLVDAPDVHGHHDISVRLHEVGEDTVVHLRRQNLQEGNRPVPFADAEGAGLPEVEGGRRNEVLHRKAAGREPVPFKGELAALRVEDVVKQFQSLLSVQHMSGRPHDLEAVEGVGLNAGKPRPGRREVLRLDGQGHILGFHIAVVAPLVLHPQNVHRLVPDGVQVVALSADTKHFIGGIASAAAVQSDLDANSGIVAVIKVAKAFKDAPLVLRPCQAVIHVLKGDGLGKGAALQPAQAVGEHILKRDAVLHRMDFPVALCLPDHRLDLLALGMGEPTLCRSFCLFSQSASPPVPVGIAAPRRNRDCWSGRCAPSVG